MCYYTFACLSYKRILHSPFLPFFKVIACLILEKVDSPKKSQQMKAKDNLHSPLLALEIYRLSKVEGMDKSTLMEKFGISRTTLWRILSTFERKNPQTAELMKPQGKDVTPEDYKRLQDELVRLKKELERERLRADFYEEMVAYGEEVYGIKLKKAGTK